MTDATNIPDEPDDRGSVSTGEQAPEAVTPPAGLPVVGDDPAAAGDSAGHDPAAGGDPAGHGGGAGNGEAGGMTAWPTDIGAEDARPAPGTPGDVPVAAVPDSSGNTPRSGFDAVDAVATPESGIDAVEPPDPAPYAAGAQALAGAPGPVPGPGPAAATPPPWRRMPDPLVDDFSGTDALSSGAAADLFDDVPTAFVEPTGPPADPSDGQWAGPAGSTERAGWSSIRTRPRPPRRAALQLKRLDPWSVLKLALVLSVVLFFIWMVAVGLLYGVLDGMGVWDRLNGTYSDLVSGEGAAGGGALISAWRVLGLAALFGAINSVLFAAALTVGAFVYNICADLVGGIEVTLSERD